MTETKLTPEQAEQWVEDLIQTYGLDALPAVGIGLQDDGRWRIAWDDHVRVERPMTLPQWKAWLEEHVGPVSGERLMSTEG